MFGALPADAVQIHSRDTSMVSLVGLFIDGDGIVYNPDGSVNEPATALAARAAVTAMTARQNPYAPAPWVIEQGSVSEQSQADATRAWVASMQDNIATTAAEIPGRIADVVQNVALPLAKIALLGIVVVGLLRAADSVPGGKAHG